MSNQLDEKSIKKLIEIATVLAAGVGTGVGVGYLLSKKKQHNKQNQLITYYDNKKIAELIDNKDKILDEASKLLIKSQFDTKYSYDDQMKRLIIKYALRDFVEIMLNYNSNGNIFESDIAFVCSMAKLLADEEVSDKEIGVIIDRVNLRYCALLEGDVEPSFDLVMRKLKEQREFVHD